jgi:excisionase family DNA binding protein
MIETKTRMMPEEAGRYIGCGYDQILKMTRLKQIPHYRIGRRVFFRRETLDLWIENQENQSVQEVSGE